MLRRDRAAHILLRDETIVEAFDAVSQTLKDELFEANTPESREEVFQQYQGAEKVRTRLIEWAGAYSLHEKHQEDKPQ